MFRGFAMHLGVCGLLLAGCAPGVVQNPDYFWFTARSGMAMGNYNASIFSQAEVRSVVASTCSGGRVASYSEQASPEGAMIFSAACADGDNGRPGRYETDKQADGSLKTRFVPY